MSASGGAPLRIDNTFGNSNGVGIYGSIASGFAGGSITTPGVSSVYQALATDALPSDVFGNVNTTSDNYFGNFEDGADLFMNNDFGVKNDRYFSRRDLENRKLEKLINRKSNSSSPPLFAVESNGSNYNLRDFNAASKFNSKSNGFISAVNQNNYQHIAPDYGYGKLARGLIFYLLI